ncbi:hypothetical protein BJ878DRAFT_548089, partial [Calycina marina]
MLGSHASQILERGGQKSRCGVGFLLCGGGFFFLFLMITFLGRERQIGGLSSLLLLHFLVLLILLIPLAWKRFGMTSLMFSGRELQHPEGSRGLTTKIEGWNRGSESLTRAPHARLLRVLRAASCFGRH